MSVYFSTFIAECLRKFVKAQNKWRGELPLVIDDIHVGFQLMDGDSNRAIFCAYKPKEGEPVIGIPVAMDLLKMCKQLKIPLIIGYNEKFYGILSSNIQWEGIPGMQFTNSGILFQKVNLETIKAEIIRTTQSDSITEDAK